MQAFKEHVEAAIQGKKLNALQELSFKTYKKLPEPSKKSEAFRYFPLNALSKQLYPRENQPFLKTSFLGFESSILSINEASQKFHSLLVNRLSQQLPKEKNPFALLTHCLAEDGLFLYLSPGEKIKEPLLIESNLVEAMGFSKVYLFLGEGAELSCQLKMKENKGFHSIVFDCQLDQNARLNFTSDFQDNRGVFFESFRAALSSNATLSHVSLSNGAEAYHQDIEVQLLEEKAHVDLRGLAALKGKAENHISVKVHHKAYMTTSHQHYKALVDDEATSCFDGKIFVTPEALLTDAYQLSNHLLLSDRARGFSKPGLEILADDVKASHGATTGQIDEAALLYLMARGLSQDVARHFLIQAFCSGHLEKSVCPNRMASFIEGWRSKK